MDSLNIRWNQNNSQFNTPHNPPAKIHKAHVPSFLFLLVFHNFNPSNYPERIIQLASSRINSQITLAADIKQFPPL